MPERLTWNVAEASGATRVVLRGAVDEGADFAALANLLRGKNAIRFDLQGIQRINSCGVLEWVNFFRGLGAASKIQFERCSPFIVWQMNMISNFKASATVLSVMAPYVCTSCGHAADFVVELKSPKRPTLGPVACPKCAAAMAFDDLEDGYFAFM